MIRKFSFLALVFLLMFSANISAYSADTVETVTITGGIVDEDGTVREKESTFDEKRTIAGLAPNNTEITITVYLLIDGTREDLDVYELTVGLSEMFSLTVDLHPGDNYIEISSDSGGELIEYTCVITRKPSNIKAELKNSSILPWQTVISKTK